MNDKAKRSPKLKVWPVTTQVWIDGNVESVKRYIEANTEDAAIRFAFQPLIGEPLTSEEVLTLIRTHPKGIAAIEIIPKTETTAA